MKIYVCKCESIKTDVINTLWHVDNNRKVLGDKRTLEDVQQALTNITNYIKRQENI